MAVTDYSTTPGSNTTISGVNIAENCSPAGINNAIRQLMADIAAGIADGSFLDGTYQPSDATLTAFAGVTFAADTIPYATAADTFSTTTLTAFARTLLDDADAATALATLGAFSVDSSSLAKPGYIKFSNGFMIQWGSGSIGANTTGTITYPQAFTTFAVCVPNGGPSGASSEGDVHVYSASGLSTQAIVNSGAGTATYNWIAVGK